MMSDDEIVRALRGYAKNAQENFEADSMRDFDAAADLIESLQAQLAESQRREQAAVEDAKQGSVCRTCYYLNNGCEPLNLDAGCHKWQWRGPQEAGKGENNA